MKSYLACGTLLLLAGCSAFAANPSAADVAKSIRQAGLDPDQCYRVRDLSVQKEDIRLYLTDGYLIFSRPVAGEPRAALFTTEVEGGDGEVILLPPYRGERQSLAMFTQSANLDEHFSTAVLIFTEGTGRKLLDQVEKAETGRKSKEMGVLLADKWGSTLSNIQTGFELRIATDVLAARPEAGLLFLALSGRKTGNFDLLYDANSREQVMAGQLIDRNGQYSYNVWTSFPARSFRGAGGKPPELWFTMDKYRINASLDAELKMTASTKATVRTGARPLRVFPFNIANAMHVTAAKIDGVPAELFQENSLRGAALRNDGSEVFLVVAPEPLAAQSEHEFEFEHNGSVISVAGSGVYFVGARATWYPRGGEAFASYDVTFRYPKRLTLVTAGDLVEDKTDLEWRTTRRRTPVPIRQAGFNLGEYEKVSGSVPGYTVEVYGNRHLETALQPRPSEALIGGSGGRGGGRGRSSLDVTPFPPDPLGRLRAVAADISASFEFFVGKFGPPALKTLTVAPIPGTFGQGFPGLVYLSTLSYLDSSELPAGMRDRQKQVYFADLIGAHEVAHQWWGNVVTTAAYQDEWLLEALSSYSSLLWLEKKKGVKAVESVLDDYRDHLLVKNKDDRTVESAGPIVWGVRLDSAGIPDAWRAITYEKGAWILHMLRQRMGDAQFSKMLAELRRRFEFRSMTTEDFRVLAKEFRAPRTSAAQMDEFFDNWVYSTGVPSLKLRYSVKGTAPSIKITGTVVQSGVDEDFSTEAPIEIQFAKAPSQTIWVRTSSEPVSFSATVRQTPLRVTVAASSVLVSKK